MNTFGISAQSIGSNCTLTLVIVSMLGKRCSWGGGGDVYAGLSLPGEFLIDLYDCDPEVLK